MCIPVYGVRKADLNHPFVNSFQRSHQLRAKYVSMPVVTLEITLHSE